MLSARAFPPFLPIATAAGSLPCSSGVGSRSGFCPVAMSMIDLASWLGSLGRFGGHDWLSRALIQSLHSGLPIQHMASSTLLKPVMCSCWPPGYFARMYQSPPTLWGSGSNLILSGALAIPRICAPSGPFSSPSGCHNQTDPLPSLARRGAVQKMMMI
jgi:hypothetical protein